MPGAKRKGSGPKKNAKRQRAAAPDDRAEFLRAAGFTEIEGGHFRVAGYDYLPTNPAHSFSFRRLLCEAGISTIATTAAFSRWLRGGTWKIEDGKFKCKGKVLPCELFATQSNISNTILPRVERPGGLLPEVVKDEAVAVTDEISAMSLGLAYSGDIGHGFALYATPVDEDGSGYAYFLVDCRPLEMKVSPVELAHGAATLASKLVLEQHLIGLRNCIMENDMECTETRGDDGFVFEIGEGEVVFKLSADKLLREILVLAPGGRNTELGQRLAAAPPPAPPVLQDWQKALRAAFSGRLTGPVSFTVSKQDNENDSG
eukprot:TRINITY_DN1032_c0_g1_i2.p1 TRINITY_DN1032_c0_g1~~TRINITY_DN1032_c0_g1_i2.p1  ORF type:complete len:316 (+),score=98.30 TRINITY_DN1032_c0_g1_i2:75-1022(+)